MAHTYSHLQPSLPTILRSVVSSVSDALESEIGLTTKFKHNSFTALMNELVVDTNSTTRRDKYPLIALIQPYSSNLNSDSVNPNVTFDLIICTLTDVDKSATEREEDNYDAILRPIYAELLSQISEDGRFHYKGQVPEHRTMDIYHLGDERGNKNGYIFPDIVDAILIEGMKLRIDNNEVCSANEIVCEPIHEIELYHSITDVSFGAAGNTFIEVTMTDVVLVEDSLIPTDVEYSIDWGDASAHEDIELDVAITHDLTGLQNGVYIGTITSSLGAIYQFEYSVSDGRIATWVCLKELDYAYDLDCSYSFEYPVTISYEARSSSTTFTRTEISEGNGNVLVSYPYTAANLETESYVAYLESLENSYIVSILTTNNNLLENTTILNIKII